MDAEEEGEMVPTEWEDVPVQVVCCLVGARHSPGTERRFREEMERAAGMTLPDDDEDGDFVDGEEQKRGEETASVEKRALAAKDDEGLAGPNGDAEGSTGEKGSERCEISLVDHDLLLDYMEESACMCDDEVDNVDL